MTEFKIQRVKQVTIQGLVQEDLENFLYLRYIERVNWTRWTNGMIIHITNLSNMSQDYEDLKAGLRFYNTVVFVKYSNYTKTVKSKNANFEMMLGNQDNTPRMKALAEWIKSQPEWNLKPEPFFRKFKEEQNQFNQKTGGI